MKIGGIPGTDPELGIQKVLEWGANLVQSCGPISLPLFFWPPAVSRGYSFFVISINRHFTYLSSLKPGATGPVGKFRPGQT